MVEVEEVRKTVGAQGLATAAGRAVWRELVGIRIVDAPNSARSAERDAARSEGILNEVEYAAKIVDVRGHLLALAIAGRTSAGYVASAAVRLFDVGAYHQQRHAEAVNIIRRGAVRVTRTNPIGLAAPRQNVVVETAPVIPDHEDNRILPVGNLLALDRVRAGSGAELLSEVSVFPTAFTMAATQEGPPSNEPAPGWSDQLPSGTTLPQTG